MEASVCAGRCLGIARSSVQQGQSQQGVCPVPLLQRRSQAQEPGRCAIAIRYCYPLLLSATVSVDEQAWQRTRIGRSESGTLSRAAVVSLWIPTQGEDGLHAAVAVQIDRSAIGVDSFC